MKAVKCACCSESMKRKGKTSSGAQRWRCVACGACGASAIARYDEAEAPSGPGAVRDCTRPHAHRDARSPPRNHRDLTVLNSTLHKSWLMRCMPNGR